MDPQPPIGIDARQQVDINPSTFSGPSTAIPRRRISSIYAYQVQAFLDAADVVDAEPEVIEDLLNGFGGDIPDAPGGREEDDDVDVDLAYYQGDDAEEGEDAAELDALRGEAQSAWTGQEMKEIMKFLKESGMTSFIKEYVVRREIPIPRLLYAFGICLCPELREKPLRTLMFFLKVALSRELQFRRKSPDYNTIEDAVRLIRQRKQILILTGAGISVSCGIPDFRSRNGLYASLQESGEYELDDPQQMFDITYFRENPAVFYSFASKIYPSNFTPSPCHRFIRAIEDRGKLLRNYTQNIDTLETLAGVQRVIQCHGSFATASCLHCRARVPGTEIEADILAHRVPLCKVCQTEAPVAAKKRGKKRRGSDWEDESDEADKHNYPPWVMKPDITFFGEKLSDDFDRALLEDRLNVDLIIIIGTSLKVSPVSDMIAHLPHSVPQILINKTPIKHINPDIVLLGNADDIVQHLCHNLSWDLDQYKKPKPTKPGTAPDQWPQRKRPSETLDGREPQRVGDSHIWLFEGAEGGSWVEAFMPFEQKSADPPESSTRRSKKAKTQSLETSSSP
ncbi:SIR2-domain-containing protein [Wolfiporia cocos MD-104 SS10]|uniref:SIR2-domain-containing protein n=1 Tax=Wolfiporia cocos (strain MD-104) TaxID=742152 RepID=A0A2H3JQL0_WOLCO|nr:SIR2-domain-containing protein [Wolfiporia cocos MD-104 SS10]